MYRYHVARLAHAMTEAFREITHFIKRSR